MANIAAAAPLNNADAIRQALADPDGTDGEFSFIVIGDTRHGDAVHTGLLEQALAYDPVFVINTGDMVNNGTLDEWEHYRGLIADYPVPIIHVAGNHDIGKGRDNYRKLIGEFNWSFDYADCRFIGLDNSGGTFAQYDLDFASEALNTTRLTFVAFHKPPAVGRWKVHSMAAGKGGEEMLELIADANVCEVYLGHIHLYDEMQIGAVNYIISGGGGAGLYGHYDFGKAEYGFMVVHVKDGQCTSEWVKRDKG
jgi:predicted phosphodiesterase